MRTVQVTPVLGLPRVNGWSHVISHPSRGLIMALAVEGRHAGNVGRDLTDYVAGHLPNTAEQLYRVVNHLIEEAGLKDCQLQLAAVLLEPDEDTSTLMAHRAKVVLKRKGKVGTALAAERRLVVIQGRWRPDDVWVIMTQQADHFVDELIQKLSQGYEADTIVETLVPGLHRLENSALSALAFVESGVTGYEQPQPVGTPTPPTTPETPPTPATPSAPPTPATPSAPPTPTTQPRPDASPASADSTDDPAADSTQVLSRFLLAGLGRRWRQARSAAGSVVAGLGRGVSRGVHRLRQLSWSRPVYVGQRRQTWKLMLAAVVILALALASWWGWQRYLDRQRQISAAGELIAPVVAQLDTFSPGRNLIAARRQLRNIVDQLESAQARFAGQPAALSVINSELEQAKQLEGELSGSQVVNELPQVLNLREVVADFIVSAAAVGTNRAVFVDQAQRQVIVVELGDLTTRSVSLPEDVQVAAVAVAADDSQAWLLADQVWQLELGPSSTGDAGAASADDAQAEIVEGDVTEQDAAESDQAAAQSLPELSTPGVVIESSDRLAAGTLLDTFSDSLYVYTEEGQTIIRYTPDTPGGADYQSQVWLRSKQGLELDQVTALSIDGSIWLGTAAGQVYKLQTGEPDAFDIEGLEDGLRQVAAVSTIIDGDRLYVLEPDQRRMVVLTKQGEFVREVVSDSLAAASQLIVDAPRDRLVVANGSQLLEIEL